MSSDLFLLRKEDVGDDPTAAYERLEDVEPAPPTLAEEEQLRQREHRGVRRGARAPRPWWKRLLGR